MNTSHKIEKQIKKYIIGIDNGGTFVKASLYDILGNQISFEKTPNTKIEPQHGYSEYALENLWKTDCFCMRKVIEKAHIETREIACIAFAGQGCGFYAIDESGYDLCNAISSSDRRALEISHKWKTNGTSKNLLDRTFRYPSAGTTVSIIAWLKQYKPRTYQRIGHIFSMKDYLIYRLTGEKVTGYGCLSASCLMNMRTKEYDSDLASGFGVSEIISKLDNPKWDTEICGYVTKKAAQECGCREGTPVCGGCHDVVASAIALGISDSEPCFIITGTHAINGYISDQPVTDGSVSSTELYAFPGMYLIEESYPSSSGILEWVIQLLFQDSCLDKKNLYNIIDSMVEASDPCSSHLIFFPFQNGHKNNPYANALWYGFQPSNTKADMLRAVYEGVVFSHMLLLENLFSNRKNPKEIRMAGGATNSSIWVQLFADAIGIPINYWPKQETGTKGAAITAAVAIGIYKDISSAVAAMVSPAQVVVPHPEMTKMYQQKYQAFKDTLERFDHNLWEKR